MPIVAAGGTSVAEPLDGRRPERRERQPEPPRLVGREAAVAARAGQDRQARPAGPGGAHARGGDRERLRQLEQVVDVVRPGRAGLLDERAEHALVARERAGVGGGGRGARRGGAHLQDHDGHVALRRARQRLREARAVAVGLEEQGDRADLLVGDERREQRGGIEHGLVADRRHGVEVQAAPDCERVDGHVPALRDQRHPPGRPRHERVAPERGRAVERDEPVAVGPEQGHPVRSRHQVGLERRRARLGEARREHDGGAAAAPGGSADHVRDAVRRGRDNDRVDRLGQVVQRRHAQSTVHFAACRVDAPDGAGEPERGEVAHCGVAV